MANKEFLRKGVRFTLFVTSYSPLFLLMIVKQISINYQTLINFTINYDFFKNFGLTIFLIVLLILGFVGLRFFITDTSKSTEDAGDAVIINDVKNKNSEAINYIGTYIIPFLFQNYSSFYELFSIAILLIVIYFIYINSTLILINPILNIRYNLYEIGYSQGINNCYGMLITKIKYLEEGDKILLKRIGHKLYLGTLYEK